MCKRAYPQGLLNYTGVLGIFFTEVRVAASVSVITGCVIPCLGFAGVEISTRWIGVFVVYSWKLLSTYKQ